MGTLDTVVVTAGILWQDGKVLLAQRRPGSHLAFKWEFPGGKVEQGEKPEHCMVRELREELAIEVCVEGIFHAAVHDYPGFRVVLLCYRCSILSGEPRPVDCNDVKWVTPSELEAEARNGAIAPADIEVVNRLLLEIAGSDPARARLC